MPEAAQCESREEKARSLAPALIWLMAGGAGVGVATVYYIQPVVPAVQAAFGLSSEQASLVPAVSQAGYAAGMALLAPLGDLIDRKRLILAKSGLLVLALLATAVAPNLFLLLAASLAVGLLGSVGQDFIPVSAHLASPENRGRTIGLVTTGLLSGILLSRTLGGAVGELFGWQAIYFIAAILVALLGLAVWRLLPRQPAFVSGTYGSLLASLTTLVVHQSVLRKALMTQALLASTLGAFWSTLALMLAAPPFGLGASAAGAFGLAGVAGALGAPLFGGFADRRGPMAAIRVGCLLVAAAFALMAFEPQSMAALIVGAVLFDLGVMAGLVSHQTIVTSIDPAARSRLNGLLMTAAMIGMSLGAAAGGWAWSIAGWTGVCLTGVIAGLLALLRSLLPPTISTRSKEIAS
ncbi:MFS transporter [Bradyrhizobium sp. SZCCHNS1054]|uniref:MFS transporter n=1 Tax=Bradyrhizobium sp. SZCCHNS1054 TaxID=3057301 RepID=UPI002916B1B7|nr:MFS transporter [Bradyrhizobium sp. SZCCHNS1054]